MKKALGGLFVLCVVIVSLLAVIDLEPYLAPKKSLHQEAVTQPAATNKPETILDRTDILQNLTKSTPTPAPPPERATPTVDGESKNPEITPAPPASVKIDADQAPTEKTPPPPMVTTDTKKADGPPALKPTESAGLLTDTTETKENQIIEPLATQVTATLPKPVEKPAPGSTAVRSPKEAINLEIAVASEGNYPFSILLETLDELTTAQQAIALYRKQGLASFWVKVNLGNTGIKYRLFTGMFATEAAAQTFITQHRLTGKLAKSTSYAARIGVFRDKKELAVAFVKTSEAGTFPYILGTENGPFFLYVGAFYTLDGAESQCRELTAKGLPCKAVPRSTLPPK
jgi:cell division septation protein DedD